MPTPQFKIGLGLGTLGMVAMLATPAVAQSNSPLVLNYQSQNMQSQATLQVTGTPTRFTISANHADILDTLKLVFDQAEKQFVPNGALTGQVTLRLNNQPFLTTLDALCKQTFLRYRYDQSNGVFYLERDETAVRASVLRLRSLDSLMRDQLRLMGLSLPNENVFGGRGLGYTPNIQIVGSGLDNRNFRAGGVPLEPDAVNAARRERDTQTAGKGKTNGERNKLDLNSRAQQDAPAAPQGFGVGGGAGGGGGGTGGAGGQGSFLFGITSDEYVGYLKQNNFVSFNIPKDKPEPVYNVLMQFGEQAKVPIIIDPNVPKGSRFTLRGTMPLRPLQDALNTIAPYARLDWRWVGNTIYITPSPEFELLLDDVKVSRGAMQKRLAAPPAAEKQEEKKPKN